MRPNEFTRPTGAAPAPRTQASRQDTAAVRPAVTVPAGFRVLQTRGAPAQRSLFQPVLPLR